MLAANFLTHRSGCGHLPVKQLFTCGQTEALGIPWFPPLVETQSVLLPITSSFWAAETNKTKQNLKNQSASLMPDDGKSYSPTGPSNRMKPTNCTPGVLWKNTEPSILFFKSEFQFHPYTCLVLPFFRLAFMGKPLTHSLTTNSPSSWSLPHRHQKH